MTNANSKDHSRNHSGLDETLSAFLDGEATANETRALLDRLCNDAQMRAALDRHQRLRASLRGELHPGLDAGFANRVMAAINADTSGSRKVISFAAARQSRPVRVVFGLAMAASLAAVTVLSVRTLLPATDSAFPALTPIAVQQPVPAVTAVATTAPGTIAKPITPWNDLSPEEIAELNDYLISHNNSAMDHGLNNSFGFMRVAAQNETEFAE